MTYHDPRTSTPVDPPAPASTGAQAPAAPSADAPVRPGRRVRLEPTPPGFWRMLLGLAVALLAPFFGILFGSGLGAETGVDRMSPLYWGFFLGGLIGAVGLLVAVLGAMALLRHRRADWSETGHREGEPAEIESPGGGR
ncbi:hypothetical protein FM106_19185 [Brachybacterium faecium]|nr:hypothetical protein FM106_19185 [Brachybacterium faecium]